MNFKPILWKSVVSIIVGFLVDVYLSRPEVVCIRAPCLQPAWYTNIFDPAAIILWIVSTIIVYIIWSLFQKKR